MSSPHPSSKELLLLLLLLILLIAFFPLPCDPQRFLAQHNPTLAIPPAPHHREQERWLHSSFTSAINVIAAFPSDSQANASLLLNETINVLWIKKTVFILL
jgi:hypothetical protein